VYDPPPLVETSTVKPAGTVGASMVKVSVVLPVFWMVLT
jgi:hypothetical protein